MASLFVIQGRDQGRRFELEEAARSLGRESLNDIQLHDQEVSRKHAEIHFDNGEFELVDLNSSNGTFVNSRRIEKQTLRNGDRLQLGKSLLLFTHAPHSKPKMGTNRVDIVRPTGVENAILTAAPAVGESEAEFDAVSAASPWLARARSNLQVMYRTALAVSHTLDIGELLERIVELIFEWVEADRGCVMLLDRDSGELAPRARRDRKGSSEENMTISRTILDYVMEKKEGVLTSDAREDDRWQGAGSIVQNGVREAICVPMQGRYGVVGAIYIDTYTPPGRVLANRGAQKFSEDHLKLMVAIGHQAALAIEDTSYYSAMVQAERLAAVGQTIAILSHHVKNILQGIRGGGFLIAEGLKQNNNDAISKGWGIVERNQEKISQLVMDMLTFSKEREPEPKPASLNEVAHDCVELMQSRAAELGVELSWTECPALPQLQFDPDAMHRAILNVITNAIDACEDNEKGSVAVSVEYDAPHHAARVIVADNGEGIAAEDVRKIFSLFESGKGSRGTGLGLPVSQKILREHGGDIRVESQVGQGSRFILEFAAQPVETPRPQGTGETLMHDV